MCSHGISGHGLMTMVVLGQWFDSDLRGLFKLKQFCDSMLSSPSFIPGKMDNFSA